MSLTTTASHHRQQDEKEDERDKCLNNGGCVNDKASIIETVEQHQLDAAANGANGNNASAVNGGGSDESEKADSTDFIGNFLGPIGKWQLRTILLIYLTKIPSSWFMSCVIFTAPTPEHGEIFCKPEQEEKKKWIKIAYTAKADALDQEVSIDFCNLFEEAKSRAQQYLNDSHSINKIDDIDLFEIPEKDSILVPCKTFEQKKIYNSIITQYDLYCSRDILVAVTQFFHLFGVLCGGIIATNLLKFIEPRRVMLIGMITQIICGNITGHAHTFEMHMIFRCLSASCCGLMYTAGQLIFTDIIDGKYKVIANCLFEQFWSIGIMLLPAVASYWSSWTHLYMAISFPTLILILIYPWIPNSPRWLLQKGRVTDAKNVLVEAARVNGKSDYSPSNLEKQLHIQAMAYRHAPKEPSYCEIWRGQCKNLVAVHLAWSVYIVIYYGFLLNIRNFGRQYLEENTIVAGICEIIGTFIGLWFILNTEHKWLYTSIFNIVASFVSLSAHLIPPHVTGLDKVILLMATSMTSKIAISTTLSILMTCTTEIVSPEKRRLCGYTSTIWTRIWLLTSPFVGATSIFGKLVPQTFLSFLNILGASFTALIDTPRTIPRSPTTHTKRQSKKNNKNKEDKYRENAPELWLTIQKQ